MDIILKDNDMDLERYFDKESNTYGAIPVGVSTNYGDIVNPWQIQALVQENGDVTITIVYQEFMDTFTAKTKKVINLDYPNRGWFTLVMDVKIRGEVMELWYTDKFDEPGRKYVMFYPKRRLKRLNAEILCYQCGKENGCAYDKGEGPEMCPLLAVKH